MEKEDLTRREFIGSSAKTLVGGSVALGCGLTLGGCAKNEGGGGGLTPANGVVSLSFTDYPELQNANGSYQITVNSGRASEVINVHNVGGTVTALTAICTHQSCTVAKWNGTSMDCPCHGSKYDGTGEVTDGPTTAALDPYPVETTATGVNITIN